MDMVWNDDTKKLYHSGIDRGALYIRNPTTGDYDVGVPWNGLISVTESPEGAEQTKLYANNTIYATLLSLEEFNGSIEAYTFPDEFLACDGGVEVDPGLILGQQERAVFGMAYRQRIGSAAGGDEIGYKYHLVYGARAQPSEQSLTTVNESVEATTFSWDFETTPADAGALYKPTSLIIIDTTKVGPTFLTWLENQLYGDSPTNNPLLPLPVDILAEDATV